MLSNHKPNIERIRLDFWRSLFFLNGYREVSLPEVLACNPKNVLTIRNRGVQIQGHSAPQI